MTTIQQFEQEILEGFKARDFILQFYSRSVIQEAQPAKDIREICTGTLTAESHKKIKTFIQDSLARQREVIIKEVSIFLDEYLKSVGASQTLAMDATMAYWHRLIDLIHEHETDEGIRKWAESVL